MIKVIGQIIPCHKPSQNPAIVPSSAGSVFTAGFPPAAHPAVNSRANAIAQAKSVFQFIFMYSQKDFNVYVMFYIHTEPRMMFLIT